MSADSPMPVPLLPPPSSSIPETAFVLELGRALQTFGTGAPTLEKALAKVAAHLGLEGAIYATPTGFHASLRKEGHHSKTYLQRIEAGESNLEKLSDVQSVVDWVVQGGMGVAQAREALAEILARPPRFEAMAVIASYALTAVAAARIFGGGWREMLLGILVGGGVGLVMTLSQMRPRLLRIAPLLGAVTAAFLSTLAAHLLSPVSSFVLILSGIIALVPGLGLLTSMQELGTGNLVAGTARLAGTTLAFLLLVFGVAVGSRLAGFWGTPPMAPQPLPSWTLAPTLLLLPVGFIVAFQGNLKDYGWTFAATLLAWAADRGGQGAFGPIAGAGLAAWVLGAGCNLWARRSRRPGAVLLLPALMPILPGSLAFRGLALMLQDQVLPGIQTGFQALAVAIALMLGLLLANLTVPRRTF